MRLDRTVAELEPAVDGTSEPLTRLEESWRTRFEDFLDDLPAEAQEEAAARIQEIATLGSVGRGASKAGDHGLAVAGDLHVQAEHGSLASGVLNIDGSISLGNPQQPAAEQG
ncbi:hypothetical protein ACIRD6_21370 [Streptomyces sp. NPDC102473]|uniref:hypothetical protein n=1 Tax=Streptomyces sp. NPDC102473 TaxID=3366180 RepID=UPI003818B950